MRYAHRQDTHIQFIASLLCTKIYFSSFIVKDEIRRRNSLSRDALKVGLSFKEIWADSEAQSLDVNVPIFFQSRSTK